MKVLLDTNAYTALFRGHSRDLHITTGDLSYKNRVSKSATVHLRWNDPLYEGPIVHLQMRNLVSKSATVHLRCDDPLYEDPIIHLHTETCRPKMTTELLHYNIALHLCENCHLTRTVAHSFSGPD